MPVIKILIPKEGMSPQESDMVLVRNFQNIEYLLNGHLDHENVNTFTGLTDTGNGLEISEYDKLRLTHKPTTCHGTADYTDTIPTTYDIIERITISRAFLPFRLLLLTMINKSDPEKFIKFEVDPYTGVGTATGINSNGKTITVITNPTVQHGRVSSASTVGYGVASGAATGITLLDMQNTGSDKDKIRIELQGLTSPQTLNAHVDWMLI